MSTTSSRRVLFISQTASPIGGVETWLDRVVRAASDDGWDPVVGLVQGAQAHDPGRFREHHPDLPCVTIDGRGLNGEGRIRAVVRCLRRVQPAVCVPLTVVDAHEANCRAKDRDPGCRYVLAVHGNVPVQIADAWRHCGHADLAVCPGRLTCRLMVHGGVPSERIRHVPNGARPPHRRRVPRPDGSPLRVVYVGRLAGGEKRVGDLEPLLDALLQQGTPFRLRVVGDGGLRGRLEQAVSSRALGDRVEFCGRLSQDELYDRIFPESDVALLFSESEAFAIALVEAMMHGVVPVSSRYVGQRSEGFVREGETGLTFPVGDLSAAASCIARLDRDADLLQALSQAAEAAVCQRYTWEACCRGWLEAFRDVLELEPRTASPLPSRPEPDLGRLDRLGLPPGLTDVLRRLRLRLCGVPPAFLGGAEWPFANTGHSPEHLAMIETLAHDLDQAPESQVTTTQRLS